jgi:hypothetical protein
VEISSNFHWGLGGVPRRRGISFFFGENKGENGGVKKRLVFKYGKVLFMEKMCANKNMEGSCVK